MKYQVHHAEIVIALRARSAGICPLCLDDFDLEVDGWRVCHGRWRLARVRGSRARRLRGDFDVFFKLRASDSPEHVGPQEKLVFTMDVAAATVETA